MWIEDSRLHREAEEWTPCFECAYWHWYCADALYWAICWDYSMITKKEAKKKQKENSDEKKRYRF